MQVTTDSQRCLTSQKMSIELLLSDIPETAYTLDSEIDHWAKRLNVGKPRFKSRQQPAADHSHPAMAVNLDACIQCGRCVRACREAQVNDVIGYAFRGSHSKIVFTDDPMGDSTCRLRRVRCNRAHRRIDARAREVGTVVADKQ
jgi:formate dehydrogenase major subunit